MIDKKKKPLKHYTPTHCIPCPSFHTYKFHILNSSEWHDVRECKYTVAGIPYLKNCPCGDCLIKIMCTQPCELITRHTDANSGMVSLFCKSE